MTTNPTSTPKSLSFHLQKFALQDSEGNFVSLVGLNSPQTSNSQASGSWQNSPWQESEISAVDLGDMPCRLDAPSLCLALKKIWQLCREDAVVKLRIPHPHHDVFLRDLGYVRALLPESLAQLDPRHSVTGLAAQLGVRFEILETALTLDHHWQKAIEEKKLNYDDIQLISKQALNVIEWIEMKLQIKKSLWVQGSSASPLEPVMRKQLEEQLAAHLARGDEKAADVIRKFLENSPENNRPRGK